MEHMSEPTARVRIQLTTRDAALQLPQETGPILVSTGKLGASVNACSQV